MQLHRRQLWLLLVPVVLVAALVADLSIRVVVVSQMTYREAVASCSPGLWRSKYPGDKNNVIAYAESVV